MQNLTEGGQHWFGPGICLLDIMPTVTLPGLPPYIPTSVGGIYNTGPGVAGSPSVTHWQCAAYPGDLPLVLPVKLATCAAASDKSALGHGRWTRVPKHGAMVRQAGVMWVVGGGGGGDAAGGA